jgi:hypothetical protein
MRALIILIILFLAASAGYSAILHVPANYPTIQEAIDAASNGDTVLVASGTYVENINFNGKIITLLSSDGPEVTVIDGSNPPPNYAAVVTFENGEHQEATLDGFTIMNGSGNSWAYDELGGGICCMGSSPTIRNNIIRDNSVYVIHGGWSCGGGIFSDASAWISNNIICSNGAGYYGSGGGIYCYGSTVVENNLIYDNASMGGGGGIHCPGTTTITGNKIFDNWSDYGGPGILVSSASGSIITGNEIFGNISAHMFPSGALECAGSSTSITVTNNLFYGNSSCGIYADGTSLYVNNTVYGNTDHGFYCYYNGCPQIHNCIVWDNGDFEIALAGSGSNPTVSYSNVKGGWPGTGNIDLDPQFADAGVFDLHLLYTSPCRDAGDDAAVIDTEDFAPAEDDVGILLP